MVERWGELASDGIVAAAYHRGFNNPVAIADGAASLVKRITGRAPDAGEMVFLLAVGRFLAVNRGPDE